MIPSAAPSTSNYVRDTFRLLKPAVTFLRMLFVMVMSLTTAMSPLWEVRAVSTIAWPACAAAHTFSMVFPSNRTRCALLTSNAFSTTI